MSAPYPPIDRRDSKALLRELRSYAPFYTPEWNASNDDDVGVALAKIYSGILNYVLDRLNSVLRRNYIEYLNVLGTKLSPALPARANVTFTLAEGVKHDVVVSSGTRLATAASEKHDALTFETLENTLLTKGKLVEVYSTVSSASSDGIYRHTDAHVSRQSFYLFGGLDGQNKNRNSRHGGNLQEHCLYLGDSELFKIKKDSLISVIVYCNNTTSFLTSIQGAEWEYNWGIDPDTGEETVRRLYPTSIIIENEETSGASAPMSVSSSPSAAATKSDNSRINKRCRIVLSFSKDGAVKFDKKTYEVTDGVTLRIDSRAGQKEPHFVNLSSTTDPTGIVVDMVETGRSTRIEGFVQLTSTEESSSSSENDPKLRVKGGDALTALPDDDNQTSIASVINPKGELEIEERVVAGIKSRWIRCCISPEDFIKRRDLIESVLINDIQILTEPEQEEVGADLLFYNDIPLRGGGSESDDRDVEIYPFGAKPITLDAFYIGSETIFSRKDALVEVHYSCGIEEDKLILRDNGPTISWEYWNGTSWSNLSSSYETHDDVEERLKRQYIRFMCPVDIDQTQVNGNKNFWIRARIVSGDYGKEIMKLDTTGETPVYRVSLEEIKPPVIFNLKLSFSSPPKRLQECVTYNNLEYLSDIVKRGDGSIRTFRPFFGLEENNGPSLYLGFDKRLEKGPISLYLSLYELELPEQAKKPGIQYFYYASSSSRHRSSSSSNNGSGGRGGNCDCVEAKMNSGTWKRLDSLDTTKDFTRPGYVRFIMPPDFVGHSKFGKKDLYWIKALDSEGKFDPAPTKNKAAGGTLPRVKGIYLNTIPALNLITVENETVGSSNGERNQIFQFSRIPVNSSYSSSYSDSSSIPRRSGTKVWVNETNFITEEERKALASEGRIFELKDSLGNVLETWVLWNKVEDIISSAPNNRDFELDSALGRMMSGDGLSFGRIPPLGRDNVKASYTAGGGIAGNVETGEINSLKAPVPFVDSVTNPESAGGGMDTETIEKSMQRGPQIIKHRGQAVTIEDFEWLVREKFPSIAKVKCLSTRWVDGEFKPGRVVLVVIPLLPDERPTPSLELLDSVQQYLQERSSNVVVTAKHLRVIGPIFAKVSVSVDIYPKSLDLSPVAEKKARDRLAKFFHPIYGGLDDNGWEFGEIVCISDVYSILEEIDEIDHIDNLAINVVFEYTLIEGGRKSKKKATLTLDDDNASAPSTLESQPPLSLSSSPPHLLLSNGEHNLTLRFPTGGD
jgi:Baseplate J-like protein